MLVVVIALMAGALVVERGRSASLTGSMEGIQRVSGPFMTRVIRGGMPQPAQSGRTLAEASLLVAEIGEGQSVRVWEIAAAHLRDQPLPEQDSGPTDFSPDRGLLAYRDRSDGRPRNCGWSN